MELEILYDNEAKEGFRRGWGFSCLVGRRLLFDTGADVEALIFNMLRLNVNFRAIDKIILSHEHGDHIGGIQIVRKLGPVEIVVPKSFSTNFKTWLSSQPNVYLKEVDEPEEISPHVFTTGELGLRIKEQSLIIETSKGLIVVTGCSHPGLENILRKSSAFGEIYGVVGGFHGFNKLETLKDLRLIVPCHCTMYKREILNLYPESAIKCSAGCTIKI